MKNRRTQLKRRTRRTQNFTKPVKPLEILLKPEPYLGNTILVGVFLAEEEIGAFVCHINDFNNDSKMREMVKIISDNSSKGGALLCV